MTTRHRARNGFALLEVMIAVVVMAFGLLALAALQTSLVRASSESKARSVALSIAKDQIESLRTFRNIAGYQAVTDRAASAVDGDPIVAGNQAIGGVSYTLGWEATRYALQKASGSFVGGVADAGALPATTYEKDNEFKRIVVTVSWVDASGATQSVSLEDAIGALNPEDSARLAKLSGGSGPRKPIVLIVDPSTDAGVIPIAVGDGSATAATNPKPIVRSRTGDDTVETRFDVLIYSALGGGSQNAIAQSKVETAVVGCTCTNAAPSPATAGYRPTYWDGLRYVSPQRATSNATARQATGVVQSPYCDACCRDHHDPGAVAGPKFSPRRATHGHYNYNPVSARLELAVGGGNYLESCRLIRADGVFSVAADLSNDYYNLLETNSLLEAATPPSPANPLSPNPSPGGVRNYQNFALGYLQKRFAPAGAPSASAYNNRTVPDPASDAAANNLDAPVSPVPINPSAGLKWLHSRGLYIDYLEPPAISAIAEARANCKNSDGTAKSGDGLRDCILKVLPFTSINLTELADWTPVSGTQIKVANDDFDTSIALTTPVRGKVVPGTAPTVDTVTNANTRVSSTNSGVAVFQDIDPDDVAGFKTDAQPFIIGSGPPSVPGGTFKLNFSTLDDLRQTGYTYATRSDTCTGPFPRVCSTLQTETLPFAITVRFGHYNRSGSDTVENPCRNSGSVSMPYRVVYDVSSISSSSATASVGGMSVTNPDAVGVIPLGEYTEALVTTINEGDIITATMSAPAYQCPSNYPAPGRNTNSPDARYQCSGSGSNAAPSWSATWVPCPIQAGIPNFP